MTFLALSGAQALAAALATTGLVVLLFYLRLRRRRVVVGSSLIWDRVVERERSRSTIERLRRLLSLVLALAIALLIVLATGRPFTGSADTLYRGVAIVVDTSVSMTTRLGDGRTRFDRARELASGLVSERTPLDGFIVADTAGRVHTPLIRDRDRVAAVLESLEPFPGTAAFPELPSQGLETYLITDGVAALEVPDTVVRLSVFEAAGNVGITAFDVAVEPGSSSGYRVAFDIVNFGSEEVEVRALLSGTGDDRLAWVRSLDPGEVWRESPDPDALRGGPLRLRVESPNDALALDDTAFAYLPPAGHTRAGLVAGGGGDSLETLLSLSPGLELRVIPTEAYGPDPEIDLYLFAGFTPSTPPAAPALYFGPEPRPWLPEARGRVERPAVVWWDREHPVMRDVSLRDLRIDNAALFEADGWTAVAASEYAPVVMVDAGSPRSIVVGFALEDSDFPFHLGFPILIGNAIEWLSGESLARTSGLGTISVPGRAASLVRLDGASVPFTFELGETRFEAAEPDLFTMGVDGRRVRIAAGLGSRAKSSVNSTRYPDSRPAPGPAGSELWRWMLAAATLLLAFEWWTWHRRLTL